MRPFLSALLLIAVPLAGCLSDESSTQDIPEDAAWFVAQADASAGDVAGFVWTVPETMCMPGVDKLEVSAEASPEGASAGSGDAGATVSPDGASVSAACTSVLVSRDGATVEGHGAAASVGLDRVTLQVVPDASGLQGLHELVLMVFTVQGGMATHVATSVSTTMEEVAIDVTGDVESTVHAAKATPLQVPLEGLGLAAGDQIAFVMAAKAQAEAQLGSDALPMGVVQAAAEGAVSATTRIAPDAADFGFAFRLTAEAGAELEAAVAEVTRLAESARAEASAEAGAAFSVLDGLSASGEAAVMAAVGQAQGFDVGFFGEFTGGALPGAAENVRFLTDSLHASYGLESAAKAVASTEEIRLSYEGLAVEGYGFGLGAYGGAQNGHVEFELDAQVRDQSVSAAGAVTEAGGISLGDADPQYILEGAGEATQRLVFDLQRTAQDEATKLLALHVDLGARLEALLGVSGSVPADVTDITGALPTKATMDGIQWEAGRLGSVWLAF